MHSKSAKLLTVVAIFVAAGLLAYPLSNYMPRYIPPVALLTLGGLVLLALHEQDRL